jgi:hypothetical protein
VHPGLPDPGAPIADERVALVRDLIRTESALEDAIAGWLEHGDPRTWPPPDPVVYWALHQQRIYQVLARDADLRRGVVRDLPDDLAERVHRIALAGARLAGGGSEPPSRTPRLDVADPPPADVMRAHLEEAEARFGVDWELLAAVAFIETRFGRVVSASWAGAQGPMQFLPATWEAYGLGGNVHDPRDAVLGAANYLSASGAPRHERRALLRYNPVDRYADAVSLYAEQMRRDPTSYYAFYNWQVYVRTRADRTMRLTGPGT